MQILNVSIKVKRCVYVAPHASTARERFNEWSFKFGKTMGYKVVASCPISIYGLHIPIHTCTPPFPVEGAKPEASRSSRGGEQRRKRSL